jgi:hypothetical protein
MAPCCSISLDLEVARSAAPFVANGDSKGKGIDWESQDTSVSCPR